MYDPESPYGQQQQAPRRVGQIPQSPRVLATRRGACWDVDINLGGAGVGAGGKDGGAVSANAGHARARTWLNASSRVRARTRRAPLQGRQAQLEQSLEAPETTLEEGRGDHQERRESSRARHLAHRRRPVSPVTAADHERISKFCRVSLWGLGLGVTTTYHQSAPSEDATSQTRSLPKCRTLLLTLFFDGR